MPLRNIEYLINEFQQKMYLESQQNIPNNVLLNDYLNNMELLVCEQKTIHMPTLSLKLISIICDVFESNPDFRSFLKADASKAFVYKGCIFLGTTFNFYL